jgi:hypothetical protein
MFCNILYAPKDTANPPAYGANDGVIVLKRRILAIILVSMVFMGVVSASSINGDYKGNPIVKVMSNGKQLESDEVPAMIYDGHTVVPISLLRQIGASVTWDAYGYSVDVTLPQNNIQQTVVQNSDAELLKKYAKLANMYKLTQDLSDRLVNYAGTIGLYFEGHNSYNQNAYSDKIISDRITEIIDHYNLLSDKYNSISKELQGIDLTDLSNAIKSDYDSIDIYKQATTDVLNWNYYRNNHDFNNSQTSFDSYLRNSNTGFTLANQGSKTSSSGYNIYILKAINN